MLGSLRWKLDDWRSKPRVTQLVNKIIIIKIIIISMVHTKAVWSTKRSTIPRKATASIPLKLMNHLIKIWFIKIWLIW